ncbi:MAG TPA: D-2-hydroxyacid dehydrogenase [Gaiellaceae bacterium]|jgi:phosphoglycerate dehydrogenase-like enzyme|nr:D-2-hydroxyacid dehydrogenase [Gaiellaceae bacterium]
MSGGRRLVFTTPLQPELVQRVREVDDRLEVVYPTDLITQPRYQAGHPRPDLDRPGAHEQWDELLAGAEILFDFGPLELVPTLASRERLRWVQGSSAGVGRMVELSGLVDSEVVVTTSSGVHGRPLAEFVVLAMLMFGKNTLNLMRLQREHRWERQLDRPPDEEIRGKTVCVIGLGSIGGEVARVVRALDARVVGAVRSVGTRTAAELGVEELRSTDELDDLLPDADVIVLATPQTAATRRLLDARRLALCKPTAIVVNVGRGDTIDEAALIDALREGRLRGAALDVFEEEPLPAESPLWDLPNVFVSPHAASTAVGENERIVGLFCANLERYLEGRPLLNVFDKEILY